jgi:signal transduction histidine kinase
VTPRLLQTARSQITALTIGALAVTIAIIAVLLDLSKPEVIPPPLGPWVVAIRVATTIDAIRAVPPGDRAKLAAALSNTAVLVSLGATAPCLSAGKGLEAEDLQKILPTLLGVGGGPLLVSQCPADVDTLGQEIWVTLPQDNLVLTILPRPSAQFPQFVLATMPLIGLVSFLIVLVITLSLWALWWVNRPLLQIATNVEKFGLDARVAPLSEQGPLEIRMVAQAFNRMQTRISQSAEERTRMLVAIGHDLRTPLTRLKLRLEMAEGSIKTDLNLDLDLMHRMINGALAFLVRGSDTEKREVIDLGALAESICAEFQDGGNDVSYVGSYGPACCCQPMAVTRALNNLVENGCRYGTNVIVDVRQADQYAIIDVSDNGPGIPEGVRQSALLPFSRLDPTRPTNGGLGLGLSIVHDVVERHHGRLELSEARPHGLRASIILPLSDEGGVDASSTAESLRRGDLREPQPVAPAKH